MLLFSTALVSLFSYKQTYAQQIEPSQSLESVIGKELSLMGFENIQIMIDDSTIYLSYENRVYRSDNEALARIIYTTLPNSGNSQSLQILVQKQKIPVIRVSVDLAGIRENADFQYSPSDWRKVLIIDMRVSQIEKKLLGQTRLNPSIWRSELVLEPRFNTQLGDTRQPFRFELSTIALISVNLWKGAHLIPTIYIPLFDYHFFNQKDFIQPVHLSFHQNFKLFDGTFLKLSAGLFNQGRYGLHSSIISYTPDGQFRIFGNLAYTGQANYLPPGEQGFSNTIYDEHTFEYAPLSYVNYDAGLEWRIPGSTIALQYSYGKYLHGVFAHKALFYRNFNEYILGLQTYYGKQERNFGFYLSFPIIPSKYSVNKKFRFKPTRYLNYSYLATRDYFFNFTSGYEFSADLIEINAQVCRTQLPDYLFSIFVKSEL